MSTLKIDAIQKATILSKALPYIQKYNGKIVVIKYGGNAMKNETLKQNVMTDIVLLSEIGVHVVLVHGGGPEINGMLHKVVSSHALSQDCAIQMRKQWMLYRWCWLEKRIRIWCP